MKKRIIVTVLLLCFICSGLLFSSAFAASEKHIHPRISFHQPFAAPLPAGDVDSYYLTSDFKADADIIIDRKVELCLNGFTMDMGPYSIRIVKEGSLILYDCPESTGGTIRSADSTDEAIIVNEGIFSLNGGVLYGENRTVLFNRAEASVSGGYIRGENADLIKTIGSSMLSLNAGEIQAHGTASAVRMVADPADETAKKLDYNVGVGGSCMVSAQEESQGTLVVDAPKGRFVINGANTKGFGCPAVTVLSGNFDVYGASPIYSDTESAIVATGGKVSLYNAVIVSDEKYGVDISQDTQFLLSGSLDILGGLASVRLADGKVFSMSDYGFYGNVMLSIHTDTDPGEGNKIALSMPCDEKNVPHFISANPNSRIIYENGVIYNSYDPAVSHYHDGRNYTLVLDASYSDLIKNNYYLENDLTRSGFFTGSMVNLCLNGHTLNLSSAIKMYPGSTLNIYDCTGQGKIEANNNVIQDINDGSAKVVLHDGLLISHSNSVMKLTGDDSLVVKGGSVQSEFEGSSAVEVSGLNNSVRMSGGEIKGAYSGIKLQNAELTINSNSSISGGVYAVDCLANREGALILEGAPLLDGGSADIHLSDKSLLIPQNGFAPAEKLSLLADAQGDYLHLCYSHDSAYGSFFETVDDERSVVSGPENALLLAKTLPVIPETLEIVPGSSFTLEAQYSGDSAQPVYQWYIRDLSTMAVTAIENATEASYAAGSELASGEYEFFCTVSDENSRYISKTAAVSVLRDSIEAVSVLPVSELSYNGSERSPILESSASTKLGKQVSFSYSADGVDYSSDVPAVGPEPGEYVIFYRAEADGCETVYGEVRVNIVEPEEGTTESKAEKERKFNVDIRFIAIMAFVFLDLVLLTVYLITKVKND